MPGRGCCRDVPVSANANCDKGKRGLPRGAWLQRRNGSLADDVTLDRDGTARRRSPMPSPLRTGYLTSSSKNLPYSRTRSASVNGLEMYYEIHGSGPPLVVLHGAYITIETMGEICRGYLGPCRPIPGRKRYRDVRTRLPGATRVGREWFPSSGWCRLRGQR
jgi:hypothetical protein